MAVKGNIEAVVRFVLHKDVVLNADQEQLMQRLQFADEQLRSRKFSRQQVINSIVTRFNVSEWRADQDITDAHKVFGNTRKLNKAYLLSFHLDDIQEQIQMAKRANRLELLPKLNDNYTYALNSMPAEEKESDVRPARIVFVIKGESSKDKSVEEWLEEADKLLALSTKQSNVAPDEYIEFEDEQ